MPSAVSCVLPSRGRCLSARSRRIVPLYSRESWIASSKTVCSGVALAVLLQLSGTADCAKASDDTVTVPRGALEELLLRDLSHRIHEMDSDSLSSFMQNLKGLSAPDPRAEGPLDSKASGGSQPATDGLSKAQPTSAPSREEPVPRARVDVQAKPAMQSAVPTEALGLQPDKQSTAVKPPTADPPPQAPPDPVYSIFQDANPATSRSQADDLTAQLLGLRSTPDESRDQPRMEPATRETSGPQEGWLGILGLPLAVWTTLDKALPAELRSTSGEVLTEEVQRAVYVVKGLVLIASSALAFFLSRALLAQLRSAILGFPLAQQALRAAESTAEAARQARPQIQRRTASLLSRLQGAPPQLAGSDRAAAGLESTAQQGAVRAADLAPASDMEQGQGQRQGGARAVASTEQLRAASGPRLPGRAPAPPPPLVPTASGALYTVVQGSRGKSSGAQRRLPDGNQASARALGDSEGLRREDAVPMPVIDEVEMPSRGSAAVGAQRSSGDMPAAGEGPGGGVLWKRAGTRQASVLSSRWDEAASNTMTSENDSKGDSPPIAGGSKPRQPPGASNSLPGGSSETSTTSRKPVDRAALADWGQGRSDMTSTHIRTGLDKMTGLPMAGTGTQAGGGEKDPWFG